MHLVAKISLAACMLLLTIATGSLVTEPIVNQYLISMYYYLAAMHR